MTTRNYEQIGKSLRLLNQGLYPYAERQMQNTYQKDWLSRAENCLVKDDPLRRSTEETLREDIGALLTLMSRQWEKVFKKPLSYTDRALVSELIEVRNQWAHGTSFSTDDTYRALDSMARLLKTIEAPEADAIAQLRQEALKLLAQEQARPELRKNYSQKEEQVRQHLSPLLAKIPFNNALLLYRALTHRSYIFEHPTETEGDNEQLEFLGDSVLEFLAGDYFYERYPGRTEEELTKRRSNLVENSNLANLAKTWDLGRWMFLGKGEELTGGRSKPSLLSNAFEAVIGAYYLDSGIEAVRALVTPLFNSSPELTENPNSSPPTKFADPKGQFQHYALTEHKQKPDYDVIDESGPDHAKTFTVTASINSKVYGTGTGPTKKEAEKQAAIAALESVGR